jgi:hypothetical protein
MKQSNRLFTKITQVAIPILLCFIFSCRQQGQEEVTATLPKTLSEKLISLTPNGWELYDQVLQFTPENLYEKIDGHAEFFLAYNMIGMTFASFEKGTDKVQFIDLSIYDMGMPTNAFGVYSGERVKGASPLDLGRNAYQSGANYYIWKGQYYIQIVASGTTEELQRMGLDLAGKMTAFLADSGKPVWGLNALPQADRVPESEQYFLVDAMGLDFMRNTYMADYTKGDIVVRIFLSQRDSRDSAQAAVALYIKHANRYGEGVKSLTIDGVEVVSCDMGGSFDVVFQKGRLVGGVSAVENQSLAVEATLDLWRQLRDE